MSLSDQAPNLQKSSVQELSYPSNPISHAARIIRQEGFLRFFVLTYTKLISELAKYKNLLYFMLTKAPGAGVIKLEDVDGSALSPENLSAKAPVDERVLDGVYWSNHYLGERVELIRRGHDHFDHHRVLFVLPIKGAGGGSNSVILVVKAMRKMGVDAHIINLREYRKLFEKAYPNSDVPIFFSDIGDIPQLASEYDAVVATSNLSVPWIAPIQKLHPQVVIGYYIQDYEAYFYPPESKGYLSAASTYTMIPGQVRCVTTQWIDDQIKLHHQVESHLVGGHIDTDLFRPLPCLNAHMRPVRIAAMIRPSSERRNPHLTMEILRQTSLTYGDRVEFLLFGCELYDPDFLSLPRDFPWRLAGELRPGQIANLLNQCDIFVDYSTFQGLGLTAMESLCCGLAAVVPSKGGADTFAKHEENCLVVDTSDHQACFAALQRLIEDESLRLNLQKNAIPSGLKFYPELPAYNILEALFPGEHA